MSRTPGRKNSVDEHELLEWVRCPLRTATGVVYPRDAVIIAAEETMRWLLLEHFAGRRPTLRSVREEYDRHWRQFARSEGGPEYVAKVERGAHACRRLRDLLQRFEVVQPASPYNLSFGRLSISGEYAVLKRSGRDAACVLRLRTDSRRYDAPDIVSYVRWLHLFLNDSGYRPYGVLQYWLSGPDHESFDALTESTVRPAVQAVLDGWDSGAKFPSPGDWCASCQTHACVARMQALVSVGRRV